MAHDPIPDRTFICSVVFLDIISYSKESVSQQMVWKREMNTYLGEAIRGIPESERVILDTGDGAALCFLGDPEIALGVALQVQDDVVEKGSLLSPPMLVRFGVNLGSVRLIRDLNGQQNIVGDGINVGQRVMSFAETNEIMASRSFYEVVSCLTNEYKKLFHYHGICKDKHQREHECYRVISEQHEARLKASTPPELANAVAGDAERPYCEIVLSPQSLRALEETLMPYVGPMAKILVSKVTKSVANLTEMCLMLGQQIPDEQQRNAFIGKAMNIIQGQPSPSVSDPLPGKPADKKKESDIKLDDASRNIIEKEICRFLGALGAALFARQAGNSTDPWQLCDNLARSIANPQERKEFLAAVKEKLLSAAAEPVLTAPAAEVKNTEAKTQGPLSEQQLARVAAELAVYLGPIAKTLIKREGPKAESVTDLCVRLREHFPSRKEWEAFAKKLGA